MKKSKSPRYVRVEYGRRGGIWCTATLKIAMTKLLYKYRVD